MNEKNYITIEGVEKLKAEYHQLFHNERPKLVETVAWAASNGDRSENADYQYGKKRLREIDRRLRFLTSRIEAAEIVNPSEVKSDKVLFGAWVSYTNESGQLFKYQIVGEDEFDVKSSRISWKSPLARALLGKTIGSEIKYTKPNGDEDVFEIVEIQYK